MFPLQADIQVAAGSPGAGWADITNLQELTVGCHDEQSMLTMEPASEDCPQPHFSYNINTCNYHDNSDLF